MKFIIMISRFILVTLLTFTSNWSYSQLILNSAGSGDNSIIQPGGAFGINIDGGKFQGSWNNYYAKLANRNIYQNRGYNSFFGIQATGEGEKGDKAFSVFSSGSINPKANIQVLKGFSWISSDNKGADLTKSKDFSEKQGMLDQIEKRREHFINPALKILNENLGSLKFKSQATLKIIAEEIASTSGDTKNAISSSLDATLALITADLFIFDDPSNTAANNRTLTRFRKDVKDDAIQLFYDEPNNKITDEHQETVDLTKKITAIDNKYFNDSKITKIYSHSLYLVGGLGAEKPSFVDSLSMTFEQITNDSLFWKPSIGIGYNFSPLRKYWIMGLRADVVRGTNSSGFKKASIEEKRVVNSQDGSIVNTITRSSDVLNGLVDYTWQVPVRLDFILYKQLLSRSTGMYSDNTLGLNPYFRYTVKGKKDEIDIGLNLAFFTERRLAGGFFIELSDLGSGKLSELFQLGIVANYSLHPIIEILDFAKAR
uniref:Uncharacterized protein n=1 Tax=Roseihalotalea indica TaxID=2867963 RepID=A0AA49JIH2_9BACT|nr:hypothetical protein K4G66_21990 [Tunicatimonas sp. TK19036]